MTIAHHPSEESLAGWASGTLGAGPRLVVATHLGGCPRCRAHAREYEAMGGALLEEIAPSATPSDLLARAFARIDAAPRSAAILAPLPIIPGLDVVPPPLRGCVVGRWRFVQPGFRWSRVILPDAPDANVIMLRVGAGKAVPQHGHKGREYTQVLTGRFHDAAGSYGPGDCVEADDDIDHQPIVDAEGECICLAAVDGRLLLRGLIARFVQPLIGL